jgi:GAF domain-containing protein
VAAHHLALLWQRILDLSLLQPTVAVRWLATAFLLYGLIRLRRAGVPLLLGRSALGIWLLVLLLHVSFLGPRAEQNEVAVDSRAAEGIFLILPAAIPVVALAASILRRLAGDRGRDKGSSPAFRLLGSLRPPAGYRPRSRWLPVVSCRPPPALAP